MSRIPIFLGTAVSSWSATGMTLEFGALAVTTFRTVSGGERAVITSAGTTIAGVGQVGGAAGILTAIMSSYGSKSKALHPCRARCLKIPLRGAIG